LLFIGKGGIVFILIISRALNTSNSHNRHIVEGDL